MKISIVIPVLNEEGNIKKLIAENVKIMNTITQEYEIVIVDDGSWDKTFEQVLSLQDPHVVAIKLRDNFGQSAAMDAGFKNASGDIIITMDGDLQNDPADIPKILKKMSEGYDIVSGWRYKRKDSFEKRIASRIAYAIRKKVAKLDIHDSGCSLKGYTKESLKGIDLAGEMHRYIPDLCTMKGFKVGEVKVNHRARVHGKTKYKSSRMLKGLLDLIAVYFWQRWAKRPMHFFGGFGFLLLFIGGIIDAVLIFQRIVFQEGLSDRPLFVLANFALIMGIQLIMTGIIADISMKNYYKISGEMNYSIEKIVRKNDRNSISIFKK